MGKIKQSFEKVKKDINSLKNEISLIKENLDKINEKLSIFSGEFKEDLPKINNFNKNYDKNTLLRNKNNSTNKHPNSTHNLDTSTHNPYFKGLKPQNLGISTGNQGASTDRQTDRQTDRHINSTHIFSKNSQNSQKNNQKDSIEQAAEIFDSLDNIKKEIRLKFKRLTNQEMLVFSAIYQIEEEKGYANYKEVSKKINLSESSIRDYVSRLIKKGIPVEKNKINNKNIQLNISQNLKKVAPLSIIIQLRDL